MELSNSLSSQGNPDLPVATLLLRLSDDGETMQLSLQAEGPEGLAKHEATLPYRSPVDEALPSETRWLLEDHPRLRGRSSDPIASRIQKRLLELASELRQSVFESTENARPIREALADPELVRRLRVVVEESDTPQWTPWELMLAPESSEPLSVVAASFTRSSPSSAPAPPSSASEALRVLLVTCRPAGEDDVPFRSVASRIIQAVSAASDAAIEVEVLRPPTYPALQAAVSRAASAGTPFDVVHFDGHGAYRADLFDPSKKRCYLAFEGPDGDADEVSGSMLGEDLAKANVRWLLLNACRSAYAENAAIGDDPAELTERAFGSLATEVRQAGVRGVLAVGFNLYVVTAAKLVADAYAALAAGRDLGEAVAYARRQMFRADPAHLAGAFDWIVPIAFHDEADEPPRPRTQIRDLGIQISTTTPASAGVIDSSAKGGPRSDERPFFGRDEVLLRLDRACTASRSVEIVGLSGSGKSAVAGELARWWVATTSKTSLTVDLESCAGFAAFETEMKQALAAAQQVTSGETLIVIEGASNVIEAGSEVWNSDERTSFAQWLEQCSAPVILTGRVPCGLAHVETIVLEGLDTESRAELAANVGFTPEAAQKAPGFLRWSQGVPEAVLQIPRIVDGVSFDAPGAARKLLWDLRSGKTETPQLGLALIENTGLEFFDVRHLKRAALPFVLHLFQGYVGDHQWDFFCKFAAAKGFDLARDATPIEILHEELRPAVRAGLATRISKGYLLHPLATIAIEPGIAGTLHVLARGDTNQVAQIMGLVWVAYVQSISVTSKMAENFRDGGDLGAFHLHRENLLNAVDIALLGAWWGLALPLLHRMRDMLLAEAAEEEWREVLAEVLKRLQESPPDEQEMGPESAELQIIKLLTAEAERDGNYDLVKQLSDLRLRIAYSTDTTIVGVDQGDRVLLDVGRIRQISALLKRGDAAQREGSPECIGFYNEALRLSETEPRDILRGGEVHLAIARAYLNVKALRDPQKYEHHARQAIAAGRLMGPLGKSLEARGSVSLGNAILEEQGQLENPDRDRLNEARTALNFAATAEAADASTRGSAHSGLGNLFQLENNFGAAADEYLAACKEFETADDQRSLVMSQTNGALALARSGRLQDARNLALAALTGVAADPMIAPQLIPTLEAVLANTK